MSLKCVFKDYFVDEELSESKLKNRILESTSMLISDKGIFNSFYIHILINLTIYYLYKGIVIQNIYVITNT